MTDFVSLRDRDATNAIRGYVYQVDLTIERWLGLKPGQTLDSNAAKISIKSLSHLPNHKSNKDYSNK